MRIQGQLGIGSRVEHGNQRRLAEIGAGELFTVGFCLVSRKLDLCDLSGFKHIHQIPAVVTGQQHKDGDFAILHIQLLGNIIAQHAGLGIVKLVELALVCLATVGQEDDLGFVGAFKALPQGVAFLKLLLAADPQGLRHDLLEITVAGEENIHRIIFDMLAFVIFFHFMFIDDLCMALGGILFDDVFQFFDDEIAQLCLAAQNILQTVDLIFQIGNFL